MNAEIRIKKFIKSHQSVCLNLQSLVLIVALFLIGFGQLQRVQLSKTVAFYAHDLFVIIFISLSALKNKISKTKLREFFSRWRSLIYFFLWAIFGLIFNQQAAGFSLIPWLYLVRLIAYLLFAFSISIFLNKKTCFKKMYRPLFVMLGLMFLTIGYSQYLLIPDLRYLENFGWDAHYYRWASIMLDPNFSGVILVIFLFTWLIKVRASCKKKLFVSLPIIAALALTYSRSSYLSYAFVTTIFLILPDKMVSFSKKAVLILFIGFLLMLPVLPKPGGLGVDLGRTETITSRAKVNEAAMSHLSLQDLVIGKGFFTPTVNVNVENRVVHAHFPDNLIVFIITSTGIPGALIAIKVAVMELKTLFKKKDTSSILIISAVLVHSMFNLTLFEPITLLILLISLNHPLLETKPL